MALHSNVLKSNYSLCRYLLAASNNQILKCLLCKHSDKSIALDSDCIDDFTTQLMQRKSDKWEIKRAQRIFNNDRIHIKPKLPVQENTLNIEHLDVNNLDMLLNDAVEVDNISYVKEIIDSCVKCKKLPTVTAMLRTLLYCSQNGDKETITSIIELCGTIQPGILKDYSGFKHYLAKAIWVKGNISNAIVMFEDVYRNNLKLRRVIRFMLKQLLLDAVANRSEATLLNMIQFSERLMNDFDDYYPMACIWQACFLSEWFTDQTIALDLLEENEGLLTVISGQILFLVTLSLKKHQTEVVYRLLELLLRLKKMSDCTRIVEALFDYRVSQGDLRGCSEIIKWSVKQEIDIQAFKHEPFVNLLMLYASNPTLATYFSRSSKEPSKPGYQFKF